ncbi:MAG TPA: ribonuclease D [Gemmatimonadaceae bacterium]|nr:ribonuclease D [Gemmatimonadaceae bacterium]
MPRQPSTHSPVYIDSPEDAERFLASIADASSIAVDTEGASFHRFVDRVYLLQLSTRDVTAVLDPLAIGKPEGLGRLLEGEDVEVVFHDADYDLRLLHQDYGWHANHIFDTRIAAQLLGIRAFGLAALLERYFGVKLDKKHQRADWSMRPLPQDMLDYAALDTMYLLELRDRMKEDLERAGRWEWAREEFQRLEGTRWAQEEDENGYLRIKGARDLNRRELALFRELVHWRDGVARELDRATFRVAGNEVLLEIARQAPRTMEALTQIKGVPRGIAERRGDEILDAVRRGLAVPDDKLPKFPRPPRWERDPEFDARVNRLRAVRDAAAQRLDLDPGFLMSRERLETIARIRPKTEDALLALPDVRKWQVGVLGRELLRAVEG